MSYLVTVTFDLRGASGVQYAQVEEALERIGLSQSISDSEGDDVDLPMNTYSGEFSGASCARVRDDVLNEVQEAISRIGVRSRIFVAVGDGWAWGSGRT